MFEVGTKVKAMSPKGYIGEVLYQNSEGVLVQWITPQNPWTIFYSKTGISECGIVEYKEPRSATPVWVNVYEDAYKKRIYLSQIHFTSKNVAKQHHEIFSSHLKLIDTIEITYTEK